MWFSELVGCKSDFISLLFILIGAFSGGEIFISSTTEIKCSFSWIGGVVDFVSSGLVDSKIVSIFMVSSTKSLSDCSSSYVSSICSNKML